MSRWDKDNLPADPLRCGVIIGSGMGGLQTLDDGMERLILGNKNSLRFHTLHYY